MSIKESLKKEKDIPVKSSKQASFGDLEGIDAQGALERLKVGTKTYAMSLEAFFEDYTDIIDKIKDALNRKNVPEVRQLLHTLSGAAGNIGAVRVEKAASMIGTAIKEGQSNLTPLIGDLEIALNTALKSVNSVMSKIL